MQSLRLNFYDLSKEWLVQLNYILARLWEAIDIFAVFFIGFDEQGDRTRHVQRNYVTRNKERIP